MQLAPIDGDSKIDRHARRPPKIAKVYGTRYSQAVTHPSTNRARRCLTSVIGREPVLSTWYGRRRYHASQCSIYVYAAVNILPSISNVVVQFRCGCIFELSTITCRSQMISSIGISPLRSIDCGRLSVFEVCIVGLPRVRRCEFILIRIGAPHRLQ